MMSGSRPHSGSIYRTHQYASLIVNNFIDEKYMFLKIDFFEIWASSLRPKQDQQSLPQLKRQEPSFHVTGHLRIMLPIHGAFPTFFGTSALAGQDFSCTRHQINSNSE